MLDEASGGMHRQMRASDDQARRPQAHRAKDKEREGLQRRMRALERENEHLRRELSCVNDTTSRSSAGTRAVEEEDQDGKAAAAGAEEEDGKAAGAEEEDGRAAGYSSPPIHENCSIRNMPIQQP